MKCWWRRGPIKSSLVGVVVGRNKEEYFCCPYYYLHLLNHNIYCVAPSPIISILSFNLVTGAVDKFIVRSAKSRCSYWVGLIKMGGKLGGCSGNKGGFIKKIIKTCFCGFPPKIVSIMYDCVFL